MGTFALCANVWDTSQNLGHLEIWGEIVQMNHDRPALRVDKSWLTSQEAQSVV